MRSAIVVTALLLSTAAVAQDIIYSGVGFGTYYYDVIDVNACGTSFKFQNEGDVECSLEEYLSLDDVNSDYLVAMNHTQLVENMGLYCGKKVNVYVNGVKSDLPLFIGDGCGRCSVGPSDRDTWNGAGSPGLDFSYSVLSYFSSEACTDGHIDISWEIVDEKIYNFATTGTSASQGWVSSTLTGPVPTHSSPATASATVTVTATATTSSVPTGPCSMGTWHCRGAVLEECLNQTWVPVETCGAGRTCTVTSSAAYCGLDS